ncbi:hypothetical protein [Actinomycetospora termitidis]|uniref:Uncharacterized protein n=1 Tax=Actinomycetospora termitidis TaxID=3053470 RepID=A0ABT7M9M7_9PSEU|nr:hypothetical protein [Actinomycetospora sp. Odt1-22]MDL5157371.1 hypothetical protein [Actinomycetospora sp. Odt1-22]
MGKRAATTWVDALARLRPRDRAAAGPVPVPAPTRLVVDPARACAITGAKRAKKKCCRSTPRCKGCPVVLMRAARAAESGLTGKELARAVKRARAA